MAALLLLGMPSAAQPLIVNFEDVALGGAGFLDAGSSMSSGGFDFQSAGTIYVILDPGICSGGCADSGDQTVVMLGSDGSPAGGPLTLSRPGGQAFLLHQIDLAEGIASNGSFPPATSLTLTGTLAVGPGTVEKPFFLNGIIDAAGPADDFETFFTSPPFSTSELASITITSVGDSPAGDGAFPVDNIIWSQSADQEAPTVPTGLIATPISETQIDLNWSPSVDNVAVAQYQVFRDGVPAGASATTSFSDVGLIASTQYS